MEDGVFVTNIKGTVDTATLRAFFGQFGTVSDLNLQPDKFNEANKVCYLRFSTPEGASKCVKQGDRSTQFGEPLKVALKRYTERNPNKIVENKNVVSSNVGFSTSGNTNGVTRMHSFGRGRGALSPGFNAPGSSGEIIHLKNLQLPLEKKCVVEIIELTNLTNILVRPVLLTESFRANLYSLLEKHNLNSSRLVPVRNAEIDGFYLAKWNDDNNFYRAKIINKISDGKYEVCFVDEGTIGDIVTELRLIPDDIKDIPCQFVPCTTECNNSKELIDLVLKEGSDKEISVYCISSKKVNNKCIISIFINDTNIVDIYKSAYNGDPRIETCPKKSDVKSYVVGDKLTKCQVSSAGRTEGQVTVTISPPVAPFNPQVEPLMVCPATHDLMVFKDPSNGAVQRCVIVSAKLIKDRWTYSVDLIDSGCQVDVTSDALFRVSSSSDVSFPPRCIQARMSPGSSHGSVETYTVTRFYADKDLYELKPEVPVVVQAPTVTKKNTVNPGPVISRGEQRTVIISHIESVNEFYAQQSDEASLMALDKIQVVINSESSRYELVSPRDLRTGQSVVAPFQSVKYRASVTRVDDSKSRCLCFFVDFGNSDWVPLSEVLRSSDNDDQGRVPPLAMRCRLPVTVPDHRVSEATQILTDYCEGGEIKLRMKVLDHDDDSASSLVVSLVAPGDKSPDGLVDLLQSKGLVTASVAAVTPAKAAMVNGDVGGGRNDSHHVAGARDTAVVDPKAQIIKRINDLERRLAQLEAAYTRK